MSAGHDYFKQLIERDGPIPVNRFMADALGHPDWGYYTNSQPFGEDGDFITAPETSQMFGELIGVWLAQTWIDRGCPPSVQLVELGPGRGLLMHDILRAASSVPGFLEAIEVHLVEMSARLIEIQKDRLSPLNIPVFWHPSLDQVPENLSFIIANEFFDALPIRQFEKEAGIWRERKIGYSEVSGLCFTLSRSQMPDELMPSGLKAVSDGSIFEICPGGEAVAQEIGVRLSRVGGVALLVDYGYWAEEACLGLGDTLQAVKNHEFVGVLDEPGVADLTAHVDFFALTMAAARGGAVPKGITSQGNFLKTLGIEARAAKLKENLAPDQQQIIDRALDRLSSENQMGRLFKVLGLGDKDSPSLIGF